MKKIEVDWLKIRDLIAPSLFIPIFCVNLVQILQGSKITPRSKLSFRARQHKLLGYESEVIECEKLLKFYRARLTLSYTRV